MPVSQLDHLLSLAREAARFWAIPDGPLRLISHRENAVFAVRLADGGPAALRLHRPGYMDADSLGSEIQWLAALARAEVPVPAPIPTPDGRMIVTLPDGTGSRRATLLDWVTGSPMGASQQPLTITGDRRRLVFENLGRAMAALHDASDRWSVPSTFRRPAWDRDALVGDRPFWGRFWEAAPGSGTASALLDLRDRIRRALDRAGPLDYGLIHADLVRENVLIDGDRLHFIDFDDAGFGWRMFDIATALLPNLQELDCSQLCRSLVTGYHSRRPVPAAELALLPVFLVARALTYVGWSAARPELDPTGQRLKRHIDRALDLARQWQEGWSPLADRA